MTFFELVVRSPGLIFGPLMLLTGAVAVAACVRATRRPDRAAARRALGWSALPPVLGVVGAAVGAAVGAPNPQWTALAATVAFGGFVAAVPALWSLVLLRRRPGAIA
jgi:hypothetical protein